MEGCKDICQDCKYNSEVVGCTVLGLNPDNVIFNDDITLECDHFEPINLED